MTAYDAVIVGAGPAGSSIALRLARAGHTCLLVDGATFPRDKVCGEGIMPAGVRVLDRLGLLTRLRPLGQTFHGIRYRLPDGTAAEGHFPDGWPGLAITRRDLDLALVQAAQAEPNVDLRLGTWIRKPRLPERAGEDVVLRVGRETVRARVLIGADGGRSAIRRMAGLEAPMATHARFGIGGHFSHEPREDPWPVVEVCLGAGGVELYLTPVAPDLTCVAMLVDSSGLASLQGRLEVGLREALRSCGGSGQSLADAPLVGKVRAMGPLAMQAKAAHADGLILVGDAAGALDPITGEGIALALVTGELACDVLHEAFERSDLSAAFLSRWTRAREREVRDLSTLTRYLVHLAARPRRAERVVRALARAPHTLERVLAVASGARPLRSLTLRDGVRVLLGV